MKFSLQSPHSLAGDQPDAVASLLKNYQNGTKKQILAGITGSGKTVSVAHFIQEIQKPILIITHNKTLTAQWYQELKRYFPHNAIEYFVSFYDHYRPEAYIARDDLYVEKTTKINDEITRLRLRATMALSTRDDVIVVASVSSLYGLGEYDHYIGGRLYLWLNQHLPMKEFENGLSIIGYREVKHVPNPGEFVVKSTEIDVGIPYEEDFFIRVFYEGDYITEIITMDKSISKNVAEYQIYPAKHHVNTKESLKKGIELIKDELNESIKKYESENRTVEAERLLFRTNRDLKLLEDTGSCLGIENYSRLFSNRSPGEPPNSLVDYFAKKGDYLLVIDESHQTIPQLKAMYNANKMRLEALVHFGFRLPSAYDNRPLKFEEYYERAKNVLYVSATPGEWEKNDAPAIIDQIIRPTGLLDPIIEMKINIDSIEDILLEIEQAKSEGGRVIITTITKKMAESVSRHLISLGVKASYIHSELKMPERLDRLNRLRAGVQDVIVGVNLLREGLDLPEVSRVLVLDADKSGFLRDVTSLLQIAGRAARNVNGKVVLYGNKISPEMQEVYSITMKRRKIQQQHNEAHNIRPTTTSRFMENNFLEIDETPKEKQNIDQLKLEVLECTKKMQSAAEEMNFKEAIIFRDKIKELKKIIQEQKKEVCVGV